jgi:hypothetical protein
VFLKTHRIFKEGKHHIYYSLCESLRVSRKRVLQRRVLHLGELNTTQLERWQRTIEVIEEDGRRHQMRLFTDRHREPVAAAAPEDVAEVLLSSLVVRRARQFGACWIGCKLWEELGLGEFWRQALELKAYERRLLEGDWQSVSGEVEVQLITQDKETYVLARSGARAQKESVMRWRLMRDLIRLRRLLRHGRLKDPAKVLLQVGRLKERYQQAWRYLKISIEELRLHWRWDREALRLAASRDGAYLLRTNLEGSDPAELWSQYIQLTEVEAVFRALKSDLAIRPIWHFTPQAGRSPRHGRLPGILSVGVPQAQT